MAYRSKAKPREGKRPFTPFGPPKSQPPGQVSLPGGLLSNSQSEV